MGAFALVAIGAGVATIISKKRAKKRRKAQQGGQGMDEQQYVVADARELEHRSLTQRAGMRNNNKAVS